MTNKESGTINHLSGNIKRRRFLKGTAASTASLMLGGTFMEMAEERSSSSSFDIMREVRKYRKINAHEHVHAVNDPSPLIDMADRLGMDKLVVSLPISAGVATPDEVTKCNDVVAKAMKKYPDRIMGLMFLNPQYGKESLEEIKRCIDLGMVGLKVYNQVKINDPLFYPIIEKFIDLKMVILMHAHCAIGAAGMRTKYGNDQPNASNPDDFVEAAKRYPEAIFQYAHTGGGGDWEYACKAMKKYPNIYVDTSGSNNAGGMIDYVLKYLGEDRLLFGTDGSYYQGVGNILDSDLNERQLKKIFFENFNNILRRSGKNVN